MPLTLREELGIRFVEGMGGQGLLRESCDVAQVLEACFSTRTERVLLYAENLTGGFFDLSSGEAGAVLQKLRNYSIRLAVVCPPGTKFSPKFSEMLTEENRRPHFRVFPERDAARNWLCGD